MLPDRHRFNEQLAGRFHAPILMPRLSWQDLEQWEEFIGILQAFNGAQQHFKTEFQQESNGVKVLLRHRRSNRISDEDLAAIGVACSCDGKNRIRSKTYAMHTRRPCGVDGFRSVFEYICMQFQIYRRLIIERGELIGTSTFRCPFSQQWTPMVRDPVGALGELIQMGDAPACNICGSLMVRSGTCYRCMTCGGTSGCS